MATWIYNNNHHLGSTYYVPGTVLVYMYVYIYKYIIDKIFISLLTLVGIIIFHFSDVIMEAWL